MADRTDYSENAAKTEDGKYISAYACDAKTCDEDPKTLFQKAGDKLLNPIKRTDYIPKELVGTDLLESGYSALAEYSMLNAPNVKYYAAERFS